MQPALECESPARLPRGLRPSWSPGTTAVAQSTRRFRSDFQLFLWLSCVTQQGGAPMSELPCRWPSPRLCPGTSSTSTARVLPIPRPKSDHLGAGGCPPSTGSLWLPGLQRGGANVAPGARGGRQGARAVGVAEACTILLSPGVEEGW